MSLTSRRKHENPTTADELAAVLRKLYPETRKKSGQMYSKKLPLLHELNLDIIKDVEFHEAKRV